MSTAPYWNAFSLYQTNSEVTYIGATWTALANASPNINRTPAIGSLFWLETQIGNGLNNVVITGGLSQNLGPTIEFGSASGTINVTNPSLNLIDIDVNSSSFINGVSAGSGIDVTTSLNPNVATVVSNLTTTGSGLALTLNTGSTPSTIENTGVTSTLAGTGIGVSSGTGAVTISNSGVTSTLAGTGIGVSSGTGDVTISNTGVLSVGTGTGISNTGSPADPVITNTGVISVGDGGGATHSGITIGGTSSAPTIATNLTSGTGIAITNGSGTARSITNSGVTSTLAGTGIGVSSGTGAVTISNSGVTSNLAGTGIAVSSGTGDVTITNSSPASSIAISSGTNISVSGTNPTYSIATSLTPSFNSVTISGTSNPTNFIKPYQIQDASSSVGSAAYLLSSQGTSGGVSWIIPPQSAVYKVASTTSLTATPTAYLTSVATLLSKGITITASLYFSVATITGTQIVITATLLGGSSGATNLMTQQLSLPLNTTTSYASMPISWFDTTAGTNTYIIKLSHTGGVAQPQILVNSNMVVANAQ